jgi:hypothetical protein
MTLSAIYFFHALSPARAAVVNCACEANKGRTRGGVIILRSSIDRFGRWRKWETFAHFLSFRDAAGAVSFYEYARWKDNSAQRENLRMLGSIRMVEIESWRCEETLALRKPTSQKRDVGQLPLSKPHIAPTNVDPCLRRILRQLAPHHLSLLVRITHTERNCLPIPNRT